MEALRRAFLRLEGYRWFAAFARRFGARVERIVYRITNGRITITGWLMPVMLLTSIGRRSGRERITPLMYVRDGSSFIVSSENFGQSRPAAWPLNLDSDPRAWVQLGHRLIACRARRLDDQEAERHWPALVEAFPAHETYLERSGVRNMFALEPLGSEDAA